MITIAEYLQARSPHTLHALRHLVQAMTSVVKYRGKKTLFGRDKGREAYEDFERRLRDTILALLMDGFIEGNERPDHVRETICQVIYQFGLVFPDWHDAYSLADEYFAANPRAAEERIQELMATGDLALGWATS